MITQREIYLDSNATHPLLPSVREGLAKALVEQDGALGNPASIHRQGQKAKKSVAELRDALCQALGRGDGDEFIILSGATEAVNLAMKGFRDERKQQGRKMRVLASRVEHSSVIDTTESMGVPYEFCEVDRNGQLNHDAILKSIEQAMSDDTDVLLCLQLCNNETGVAFELDALLGEIHARFAPKPLTRLPKIKGGRYPMSPQRVWVLLDAAQAFGKLDPARVRRAMHYADYMALSAHKLGGPSGIGSLWVRSQSPFAAQMTGGTQEKKRRAGTMNSLGALGFKIALQDWQKNGDAWRARWARMQQKLAKELLNIEGIVLHGCSPQGELPALSNTLNFHVDGCPEESLLLALDLDGFCVSSGSACNSGSLKPSRVLTAMGYTRDQALSSIRVCMNVETTDQDLEEFIRAVREKTAHIRRSRAQSSEILPDIQAPNG